jgi:carboxypeptidase family protein
MNTNFSVNSSPRRHGLGLALAAVIGMCGVAGSGAVQAQATAGLVFGKAPAGDSVRALSTTTGIQREVHVGADGRYALRALPVGVYTVTLQENGKPVRQHLNVPVIVGRGIKVDFDCTQDCADTASKQ